VLTVKDSFLRSGTGHAPRLRFGVAWFLPAQDMTGVRYRNKNRPCGHGDQSSRTITQSVSPHVCNVLWPVVLCSRSTTAVRSRLATAGGRTLCRRIAHW
jgi:hypothetical protein